MIEIGYESNRKILIPNVVWLKWIMSQKFKCRIVDVDEVDAGVDEVNHWSGSFPQVWNQV